MCKVVPFLNYLSIALAFVAMWQNVGLAQEVHPQSLASGFLQTRVTKALQHAADTPCKKLTVFSLTIFYFY